MDTTIIVAFSEWVSQNWVASAIVGGITWDILKMGLLTPLKTKLAKHFIREEELESFVEAISTEVSNNKSKPYRDIEDKYESITKDKLPQDLMDDLKSFFIDNKELIERLNKENSGNIIVNSQTAGRDVNNVSGTQIVINNKE